MKVLVLGQGGREHAIAWKLSRSPKIEKVFICPGNGGTALEKNIENVDLSIDDSDLLINFTNLILISIPPHLAQLSRSFLPTLSFTQMKICFSYLFKEQELPSQIGYYLQYIYAHQIYYPKKILYQ